MARSWEELRTSIADRLVRQTGHDIGWWNEQIAGQPGLADEALLRAWLSEHGVTGYQQMLLVMEHFGYPPFLLASADDLIDGQYAGREVLRPILDAIIAVAASLGEVEVQARKTYTTLLTPRRTFAAVRPATKTRVDLGLRIDGAEPEGRLLDGRNTSGGSVNLRVPLSSIDDLDDEVAACYAAPTTRTSELTAFTNPARQLRPAWTMSLSQGYIWVYGRKLIGG